jgi:hypothetical protein
MIDINLDHTAALDVNKEDAGYVCTVANPTKNIELATIKLNNNQVTSEVNSNKLEATTSDITENNNQTTNLNTVLTQTRSINDNYGAINQSSSVITTKSIVNNQTNNSNSAPITSQPKKTACSACSNVSNYSILGILKNNTITPCMNKNIPFFNLSNNYVAFDQKVSCCYPLLSYNECCSCNVDTILPSHYLKLINLDNASNNIDYDNYKDLFIKKNDIPVKEIYFNEINNKFVILYDDEQSYKSNSELYLVSNTQDLNNTTSTKKMKFKDDFRIECPLQKIHSIYYNNEDLYVIGRQNSQLILMVTTIGVTKGDNQWKEITTLAYNDIHSNAKFSSNGAFIFLLTNDNQLLIFSKEDSWNEINKLTNKNNFPVDINYNSKDMIFISNNNMVINNLHSTKEIKITLKDTTAACFIPNSTDFIVFTKQLEMTLIRKQLEHYFAVSHMSIDYEVDQAYFHPKDPTGLIVLAKSPSCTQECLNVFAYIGLTFLVNVGGACLGTCCCCWGDFCACNYCKSLGDLSCCNLCFGAEICGKYKANTIIGTYTGMGCSAVLSLVYFIMQALNKNTIQTNLYNLRYKIKLDDFFVYKKDG